MTHGDDDGLRTPPAVAPYQVVIVPMLRGKPEDADLLKYCETLAAEIGAHSAFGARVRVFIDRKDAKPADKRWDWVRRGAPIVCEIGPRDAANGKVSYLRRDKLREGEKVAIQTVDRAEFIGAVEKILPEIQNILFSEAKARLDANIRGDFKSFDDVAAYYGADDEDGAFKGWARVQWSRPTGDELERVGERLKALKLTIRNAPLAQPKSFGACIFSGKPAVEEILIARAY
jgi:prolyl-tRNA synthetase